MEDADIIFNLRLANQKLDEELRLYRNGTTPDNLLELIQEKDVEVCELRKQLSATNEKLRRIAKGSAEVIAKNDHLIKENNELLGERERLKRQVGASVELKRQGHGHERKMQEALATIESLKEDILTLQKENETLNNSMDMLIPEAEQFQVLLEELEEDACNRDTSIEKLQKRCHNLVLGNKERHATLEEQVKEAKLDVKRKNEQLLRLSEELQKAQSFNMAIKERVTAERKTAAQLSSQLLAALADVTRAQTSEANIRDQLQILQGKSERGLVAQKENDNIVPATTTTTFTIAGVKSPARGLKTREEKISNIVVKPSAVLAKKVVPKAASSSTTRALFVDAAADM
jgi:hypothetical protein